MKHLFKRTRLTFLQGILSAFRLHPDRVFLDWKDDYSKQSDMDYLRGDLEKVGADMRRVITQHVQQTSAR
jgi:hypothetical protein